MPRDPVQNYSSAERLIADLERNKAIRELREEIIAERIGPKPVLNCLQAALLCSLPTVALLWWMLR